MDEFYSVNGMDGFSQTDNMFNIIPVIMAIFFIVFFVIIIVFVIKAIKQWKNNNNSPVLTVDAKVATKREDVSYHTHNVGTNDMHQTTSSTTYYATFEVTSGDRIEFIVGGSEYGMLMEHDRGKLTFQGTRYLGFERNM